MTEIEYVEYIRKSAQDYVDFVHRDDRNVAITNSKQHASWNNCREHLSVKTMISLCNAWNKRSGHEEYISYIYKTANDYYLALCAGSLHISSIESVWWHGCRMKLDPVIAIMMCNTWLSKQS